MVGVARLTVGDATVVEEPVGMPCTEEATLVDAWSRGFPKKKNLVELARPVVRVGWCCFRGGAASASPGPSVKGATVVEEPAGMP